MSAQVRLRPRLMNQDILHISDAAGGVKCELGAGGAAIFPLTDAASCCDICVKICTVTSPVPGVSVL
jgi:hypothetical protein